MAAKKTKTTTATSDDRNKALTNALAQIEKDFGKVVSLVDASLRCMALSPPVKPL